MSFVGPTIVVIFSAFLLGERPRRAHCGARHRLHWRADRAASRPGPYRDRCHRGVGSATFYSLYLVLTRKLSGDEDSLSLLFHANAIGAIVTNQLMAPATARIPCVGWAEWSFCLARHLWDAWHWFMIKA